MKNLTPSQLDQLIRLIEAFRLTAMLVDRQVDKLGLRPVVETTEEGVPKAPKLPKGNPLLGLALMAASHFNLGIALELGLKCLTALEGKSFETRGAEGHKLTLLYDGLSAQSRSYLETSFTRNRDPHGIMWLDLVFVETPESPDPTDTPAKKRVSDSFRDLCEHFDTEFKLKTKRYSPWEDAISGKLIQYIHDSSGLFRVVEDLQRLIVNKSKRGKSSTNKPNRKNNRPVFGRKPLGEISLTKRLLGLTIVTGIACAATGVVTSLFFERVGVGQGAFIGGFVGAGTCVMVWGGWELCNRFFPTQASKFLKHMFPKKPATFLERINRVD